MGFDTTLRLVMVSVAVSLTQLMGKEVPRLLMHRPDGQGNKASSTSRSMLLSDMDGGRRGRGSMPLTSLSLEPVVCLLSWSKADEASETATCSGMPWTGGVLPAWMGWCGWYLPSVPASAPGWC